MENNPMKPDVVLVTKNVMVPLALPAPKNKSLAGTLVSKKKTKIVKPRRNKALARQTLPPSRDNDCEHSRSKDASDKTPRSNISLHYRYESSYNFYREPKENYENPYNREFVHSRDLPGEAKIKQEISSLSFPAASVTRETSKLSCETIFLSKSPRSLILDPQDCEIENSRAEEDESLLERSEDEENNLLQRGGVEVSNNNIESRRSSITEIRRLISNDVSSKLSDDRCCVIKYSWEDLDSWVPPAEKKKIIEIKSEESRESITDKCLDCGIKYSWQIVGTGVQTSETLMENLSLKEACNYPCTIKYSWQIIGTGTQVSFRESTRDPSRYEKDYWEGKILKTVKRSPDDTMKLMRSGNPKISYSEKTQTMADKVHQTNVTDCRVKYSWQNLTKPYLVANKNPRKYPS